MTSPPRKPATGDGRVTCRCCSPAGLPVLQGPLGLHRRRRRQGTPHHPTARALAKVQTRSRAEQQTLQWQARYAQRAGCEATVSETVRAHGLRHCLYRGLAKTHVQHVLTTVGTNIIRLAEATTRHHLRPDLTSDQSIPAALPTIPHATGRLLQRSPRSPTASEKWPDPTYETSQPPRSADKYIRQVKGDRRHIQLDHRLHRARRRGSPGADGWV
ncbi:transposase [Actinomadura macra]|uniref:transposase n=1 Tax=Actinomadura macra TaxID=46164 RepID=UPI0009FF520F|nr:transposase [Actinomadura macra]